MDPADSPAGSISKGLGLFTAVVYKGFRALFKKEGLCLKRLYV